MKRVYLLLAACFLIAILAVGAGASGYIVTIGTHAAGNVIPWYGASADSMRFQCLWLQSEINHAGYINQIDFETSSSTAGTFNECRVWLCHTTKTALEATFDNNYTGFTPVMVRTSSPYVFPGSTGYVDLGITPNTFNYNNTNNLLMEIRWNGDSGSSVACYRSAQANSRVFASDHNATSGAIQNNGQCIRLHIGTMTGVTPSSMGRVKAIFR